MGRPRKPQGEQQGRREYGSVVPLHSDGSDEQVVPDPPAGVLKATRDEWVEFWQDVVAQAVTVADRSLVRRLFELRDEQRRFLRVARKDRMVVGSTGQVRVNPAMDMAVKLDGRIAEIEARLGVGARARASLGLATAQTQLTVAQMNRLADGSDDGSEGDVIDVDADGDEAGFEGWQEA